MLYKVEAQVLEKNLSINEIISLSIMVTFLMLLAYCFMAIFSTVLSKPKKDLMSKLADCSKHVQSSFSG